MRDRRKLNVAAAGSTPLRHPDGHTVGLAIGEGQDGACIRWARPAPGKIILRAAPSYDRILVDIHQTGREYLTTPHSEGLDELCRHRFADDEPLDRLPPPATFDLDGHWGHDAGYLTDELVLAHVMGSKQHVLIQHEPLQVLAPIAYPDGDTAGWWCVTGQSAWLTIGAEGIQRWLLPRCATNCDSPGLTDLIAPHPPRRHGPDRQQARWRPRHQRVSNPQPSQQRQLS